MPQIRLQDALFRIAGPIIYNSTLPALSSIERNQSHRSAATHLDCDVADFPDGCQGMGEKQKRLAEASLSVCVGVNLFSRAVASQVFSAPVSLTTVFEMGTGGPSP